jgi:hypothetical protein
VDGSSSLLDKQHPQLRCPHIYVMEKSLGIMYGARLIEPKFNEKAQMCTDPSSPICHEITWGYLREKERFHNECLL